MVLTIEFVILLGWGILVFGFYRKDYAITSLASLFLMVFGVDLILYGEGLSKQLINALGLIHIAIGFYILFRGGTIESLKDKKFIIPKFRKKQRGEKENGKEENC